MPYFEIFKKPGDLDYIQDWPKYHSCLQRMSLCQSFSDTCQNSKGIPGHVAHEAQRQAAVSRSMVAQQKEITDVIFPCWQQVIQVFMD